MSEGFDIIRRGVCETDTFWRVFQGRDGEYPATRQWDVVAGTLAEAQEYLAEQGHVIDTSCGWQHQYVFAAFYAVGRSYGGPEEGGWWYDAGDLIALVPVQNYGEIWAMRTKLETLDGVERVTWCEHVDHEDIPSHYPSIRPHYE